MKYNSTDIILCFPGIGRTRFKETGSNSSFTLDYDGKIIDIQAVLACRDTHDYRYILLPLSQKLVEAFFMQRVPILIVTPWYYDDEDWLKLWMKAGANTDTLVARAKAWKDLRVYVEGGPMPTEQVLIHLELGEWLGHLLAQTPIDASGE